MGEARQIRRKQEIEQQLVVVAVMRVVVMNVMSVSRRGGRRLFKWWALSCKKEGENEI